MLRGDLSGRPLSNTAVLLTGGVLASFIGTTGASQAHAVPASALACMWTFRRMRRQSP